MSDYQKGYAAGRRRAAVDNRGGRVLAMRQEFEQAVFLAVLPQLLARPWVTGEKEWTTMDEFVDGAAKFANKASARFVFTPPPEPLPDGDA